MMTKDEFLKSFECGITLVNAGTKKSECLMRDFEYASRKDITDVRNAYGTCSDAKKSSFDTIERRAIKQGTFGAYICGANCMQYSTIYKVILESGEIAIVKDTAQNCYVTIF